MKKKDFSLRRVVVGVLLGKLMISASLFSLSSTYYQTNLLSDVVAWLFATEGCYNETGEWYACEADGTCLTDLDGEYHCYVGGEDCSVYGESPVCYFGLGEYQNWCYSFQAGDYSFEWGACPTGDNCEDYGYNPVCASDGYFYDNHCYAQAAGFTTYELSYDDYRLDAGACVTWTWEPPDYCIRGWDPVCVNGQTFDNACLANHDGYFDDGTNSFVWGACSDADEDNYNERHEGCEIYRGIGVVCTDDDMFASWCDAEADGYYDYEYSYDCDHILYDDDTGTEITPADCSFDCSTGDFLCPDEWGYDSADFSCHEDSHALCEKYRTGDPVCLESGMMFDSWCDAQVDGYFEYSSEWCNTICGLTCGDDDDDHPECEPYRTGTAYCTLDGDVYPSACDAEADGQRDYSEHYCGESCGYNCDGDYACGSDWFDNRDCGEEEDCKFDCFGDWVCESDPTYDDGYCKWQQHEEEEEEDEDEYWENELEHAAEVLMNYDRQLVEDYPEYQEGIEDHYDELWNRYDDTQDEYEDRMEDEDRAEEMAIIGPYYDELLAFQEEGLEFFDSEIWPQWYVVKVDLADLYANLEIAYNEIVDRFTSDNFWDLSDQGGVHRERMDILWWYGEYFSRYGNFITYKIDLLWLELVDGVSPEEVSEDLVWAAEMCDEILETMPQMHEELLLLVDQAEINVAAGMDADRAFDDARDKFDDMRDMFNDNDNDMWDALDEAWEIQKHKDIEHFAEKELEQIKEDVKFVKEELNRLEGEGRDVANAWDLVHQAEDVLEEMERALENEDYDMLEDLGEELEDIGRAAEHELKKLGIVFYDEKEAYIESVDISDIDSLVDFLAQVPEDVLAIVIDKLVNRVTENDLENIVEYTEEFGDIGMEDILKNEWMDEEEIDEMIEKKLLLLDELETKISVLSEEISVLKEEIDEFTTTIASYNFGDHAEDVMELQDELNDVLRELNDGGASEAEMEETIEDYKNRIDDIKQEAKEAKFNKGTIPFMDVDDDAWYMTYVASVKDSGVVSGYKDELGYLTGYYGPGDSVTVAEILKMSGLSEEEGTALNPYSHDHWSKGFFISAEARGLTIVDNATRDPNEGATRSEVLRTLFEVSGIGVPEIEESVFDDMDIYHENAEYVMYAYELGIVSGDDSTGTFRPDDAINRAEVAKVIMNFKESIEAEELVETLL